MNATSQSERIRELEEKLESNELALQSIERAAGAGRWAIDLTNGSFVCSEQFRRIYGFGAGEEVSLENWYRRVHPEDQAAFQAAIKRSLEVTHLNQIEHRVMVAGQMRQVRQEWRVESVRGAPTLIKGLCLDQSELPVEAVEESRLWQVCPGGLLSVDEEGRMQAINSEAQVMFQYTAAELTGRKVERLFLDRYGSHETLRSDFDQGRAGSSETRTLTALRKNGEEFTADVCIRPVGDKGHTVVFVEEVTEKANLMSNLAKSERKLTEILDALPMAVLQLDANDRLSFINHCARQLNLDAEQLSEVVFLEGTDVPVTDIRDLVLVNGCAEGFELLTRTGERIPVRVWVLESEQQTTLLFEESSEPHESESGRGASTESLYPVLDQIAVPILVCDASLKPVFANVDMYRRKLLRATTDGQVQCPNLIKAGTAEEMNFLELPFGKVISHNVSTAASDLACVLLDGSVVPIDCWITPLAHNIDGSVSEMLLFFPDRSSDLQAVQAERKKLEAEAANQAKSRFLANISHGLRTPLNAVLGFQQLIAQSGELQGDQKTNLEMANQNGLQLLRVINDILEISKIESAELELHTVEFSPHELVALVRKSFRQQAEGTVRFDVKVSQKVPLRIKADENKIRQIVFSLLDNAFKFTNEGEVCLEVSRGQQGELIISVADTGCGIGDDQMYSLFEPFQHLDYQAEHGYGTGLGLPIVKSYAKAMGGSVDVRSRPGRGSEFIVTLPIMQQPTNELPMLSGDTPSAPAPRVLVVDDSFPTREILRQLLTSEGVLFEEAGNGFEAIEKMRSFHPQIILMDLEMPIMDGFEATRRIKAETDVIILAISARVFDDDIKRAYEAGIDGFIEKPYKLDTILEHIDQLSTDHDGDSRPARVDALETGVSRIPQFFVGELQQAILRADPSQFRKLLKTCDDIDAGTERLLLDMVDAYQYDKLIKLLQPRSLGIVSGVG